MINVTSSLGPIPINNATVKISLTSAPNTVIRTLTTDNSRQTDNVALPTPNLSYRREPNSPYGYTKYNISGMLEGYKPMMISGTEVLPDANAIQSVTMVPLYAEPPGAPPEETVVILDHTLYGEYPQRF